MVFGALTGSQRDRADAVRIDDRQLSWEDLHGAALAVAARVAGAPVVAVHATPTMETVVAIAGCLLAGVPVVPVPPDAGPAERAHIMRDSQAAMLLAGQGASAVAGQGASAPAGQGASAVADAVPVDLSARVSTTLPEPPDDAIALMLYTSGTTGPPKGVLISHAAIAADLDALAAVWAWTPDDVLVHGLPLYHVHGLVLGVLGALRIGSRLVHVGSPRPDRYAAATGSLYFAVPTVWARICADPGAAGGFAGARLLVSGSAALPVPVFDRLHALTGHRPVERYGMTETLITISTSAAGVRRAGQVGQPLPGITTALRDADGAALPCDGSTVGELLVRGSTLFSGYLGRPDATAAAYTADGWFRTGDAATIDRDGTHHIVGRVSTDLISTGGYRVGAGEVEDALLGHPAVREVAVVGVADADLGQSIVAYVVADGVTPGALMEFAATALSRHKRPRQIQFVASLPRNAMGKIQKALLT